LETIGFEVCEDGTLEEGLVKVALFADADGEWSHVARQQPDGNWTSELGDWEDTTHESPASVSCPEYGTA
jgi:hypothetical protein